MKSLKNTLTLALSLALCACSSEVVKPNDNQAHQHSSEQEKKALCKQSNQAPSISCADTVTAQFAPDGQLWIAWVNGEHIYLQTSADQGAHYSDPIKVNQNPESIAAHGEYRPKLKFDAQGNLYLTWTQNLEKRHTGNIRFSRSLDGGKTFSQAITINDNLDIIGHRFDDLAIGKNGEIFIAWLDSRDKEVAKANKQNFLGTAVYYTWSNDGGVSFKPNQPVAPHSCECCRLGIAIDNDNLPVVLWRHVFEGQIRDQALIKFTSWDKPGNLQRVSQENWNIEACPHHGPALSIAEDGRYHAVWFSGAADKQGLFYGYSNDQGNSFSAPVKFGNQGAKHPNVFAHANQVSIVWSEFDGKQNLLQAMHSKDNGLTWSTAHTIASTPESADDGFLVSNGEQLYVSWQTGGGYQFSQLSD